MSAAPPTSADANDAILETAALWRQRMIAPDWSADDETALETWLQRDARNQRAFKQVGEVWDFFGQHAASPESLSIRRALLRRVQHEARSRWNTPGGVRGLPTRRWLGAGLAAAVLAGVIWPLATQGEVYQTGVGERRVVILQDGSVLSLDALSRVSVDYSSDARRLTLTRGQARFDVAHDPTRPFRVAARDRVVVATGTAFNIDIVKPEVRVTLIEGKVLVLPRRETSLPLIDGSPGQAKSIELRAGQGLVAGNGKPPRVVANVDLERATAWQKGKLVFDQEPLAEAVERVNRYSERKITIDDPKAETLPVSGVFNVGDAHAFLDAVTGTMPVTATEGSDGVVLRSLAANDRDLKEKSTPF